MTTNNDVYDVDAKVTTFATRIMLHIGISPSRAGFKLIRDAMWLYLQGYTKMKDINQALAKRHAISPSAVERDMRTALNAITDSNAYERLNRIYGIEVFTKADPISTKRFIATLCEGLYDDTVLRHLSLSYMIVN